MPHYDYGLIGFPLEHSFSQIFFTKLFAEDDSGRSYGNFPIQELTPQSLYSLILQNPELKGFNVTSPYKIDIIGLLDSVDSSAQAVGAVNTVRIRRDISGRVLALEGFNTDVTGFAEAIHPLLLPTDRGALILGTGGASRAAATVLRELGLDVSIVSRTPSGDAIPYSAIDAQTIAKRTVIVNATPAGMFPYVNACPPFPCHLLGKDNLCFDMIYNPEQTVFLSEAKKRGARTSNGLIMLKKQAMASLRIWENG